MSSGQVVFAIIGACLTTAAVGWSVVSFRMSGFDVKAEVGQGHVDEHGVLVVHLIDGTSKVMRVADPWDKRERRGKHSDENSSTPSESSPYATTYGLPVNVVFVHNRGRGAVTVQRCRYTADLEIAGFTFEPQPGSSPWGDLLPKRLDSGEGIVLLHEKIEMREFLNAVLRDHDTTEASWSIVLELGNGKDVWAEPSIITTVDTAEEGHQRASGGRSGSRLERIEIPPPLRRPARMRKPLGLIGRGIGGKRHR